MRRLILVSAAAAAVLSSGCFTLSNTIKEETVPPGRLHFGLGALTSDDGAMPLINLRLGLLERWDVGTRFDTLGWALDTRLQILTEKTNKVNSVFELGVGTAFIHTFWYAGVGLGKDLGRLNPYIHVRYMQSTLDLAEMAGESNNFIVDLLTRIADEALNVMQVFVGFDMEINEKWSITPEIVWVPDLNDLLYFNVALNFRFW